MSPSAGVASLDLRDIPALVWEALEDELSLDELVDDLAAVFDQPPDTIRGDVHALVARLVAMTVAERRALPWMHPGRADVIAAGALILDRVLSRSRAVDLVVSPTDILDGIAWSLSRTGGAAEPARIIVVTAAASKPVAVYAATAAWTASDRRGAADAGRSDPITSSASRTPGASVISWRLDADQAGSRLV